MRSGVGRALLGGTARRGSAARPVCRTGERREEEDGVGEKRGRPPTEREKREIKDRAVDVDYTSNPSRMETARFQEFRGKGNVNLFLFFLRKTRLYHLACSNLWAYLQRQ